MDARVLTGQAAGWRRLPQGRTPKRPLLNLAVQFGLVWLSVLFFYDICTTWIYDEDRANHLHALLTGAHKPREWLWGMLTPWFPYFFPESAFQGFVSVTASLFCFAVYWRTGSARITLAAMLSLGMVSLINESARQAFAMSIFCLALQIDRSRVRWPLMVATSLIHTVMLGGTAYVLAARWIDRLARHPARWHMFGWSLVASCAIFMVGFRNGRLTETAIAFFAVQMVGVLMLNHYRFGAAELTKFVLACTIASSFFVWTSSGLRGVYLVGVLAPFVLPKTGVMIAFVCLWAYPLAVGETDNFLLVLSHMDDFWWD